MRALKSLLIVEDEEDIIEILKIAIEHDSNIHLSIALDGEEGFKRANLDKPDLILLDVLMPGKNGLELMDDLKSNGILREIPVVFITSRVQKNEMIEYKKRGALGVIEKPFAPLEIVSKLQSLWLEYQKTEKSNP